MGRIAIGGEFVPLQQKTVGVGGGKSLVLSSWFLVYWSCGLTMAMGQPRTKNPLRTLKRLLAPTPTPPIMIVRQRRELDRRIADRDAEGASRPVLLARDGEGETLRQKDADGPTSGESKDTEGARPSDPAPAIARRGGTGGRSLRFQDRGRRRRRTVPDVLLVPGERSIWCRRAPNPLSCMSLTTRSARCGPAGRAAYRRVTGSICSSDRERRRNAHCSIGRTHA